jgi:glycosyltransferase involved in cell wall biosynthesis
MTRRSSRTPPPGQSSDPPLILHVIPTRRARGAQREARALADRLDTPGVRDHRVLSLFAGPDEVRADVALEHPGGKSPAVGFDPRLVLVLRRRLRDLDPAVVVAHGSEPLKYLVPAMAGHRRPLAYYAIGTYSGSPRTAQVMLWRFLASRADVIAAEGSEVASECVERFGLPAQRVVVAPNGRDPTVFRPATQRGNGPPTLAFVGALTDGKRPDRFIDLVADLRSDGHEVRAVLIGDGPRRANLEERARAAGVEMLGPRSDVAEQLRATDIFVFPSAPEGEGMPGVLIEAGLSGLPVVATAVPGVASVLVDGQTGLVVPVDNRAALAAAAARLIENKDLCTAMGAAARARCQQLFTIDTVTGVWMSVLEPLLNGHWMPRAGSDR